MGTSAGNNTALETTLLENRVAVPSCFKKYILFSGFLIQ
jgi:hypothetical protein